MQGIPINHKRARIRQALLLSLIIINNLPMKNFIIIQGNTILGDGVVYITCNSSSWKGN